MFYTYRQGTTDMLRFLLIAVVPFGTKIVDFFGGSLFKPTETKFFYHAVEGVLKQVCGGDNEGSIQL